MPNLWVERRHRSDFAFYYYICICPCPQAKVWSQSTKGFLLTHSLSPSNVNAWWTGYIYWIHPNLIDISDNDNLYIYTDCPNACGCRHTHTHMCARVYTYTLIHVQSPEERTHQVTTYPFSFSKWSSTKCSFFLCCFFGFFCQVPDASNFKNHFLSAYHEPHIVSQIWLPFSHWIKVITKPQGYILAVSLEHLLDD